MLKVRNYGTIWIAEVQLWSIIAYFLYFNMLNSEGNITSFPKIKVQL